MCRTICTALPEFQMCSITMHASQTRHCIIGDEWLQQYAHGMIVQTPAATLCTVALFKIQMGQIMHSACLAACRPKSANNQPGHVQNAVLLKYLFWHDRGTNQDLLHKLEPQRKGWQSSLPLPPPHCPLLLPLPKGKLAPKAKTRLL